ncbi:basic proline-rich protein-like [Choloepus didactylus]|uniref:basic proline-rich protein-like n=1 Tax=Choloepus didactylus TaxID=27675 RepID=UPI00189CB0B1|nr:basic proline-rich protein-like [Choloepus didactylus]
MVVVVVKHKAGLSRCSRKTPYNNRRENRPGSPQQQKKSRKKKPGGGGWLLPLPRRLSTRAPGASRQLHQPREGPFPPTSAPSPRAPLQLHRSPEPRPSRAPLQLRRLPSPLPQPAALRTREAPPQLHRPGARPAPQLHRPGGVGGGERGAEPASPHPAPTPQLQRPRPPRPGLPQLHRPPPPQQLQPHKLTPLVGHPRPALRPHCPTGSRRHNWRPRSTRGPGRGGGAGSGAGSRSRDSHGAALSHRVPAAAAASSASSASSASCSCRPPPPPDLEGAFSGRWRGWQAIVGQTRGPCQWERRAGAAALRAHGDTDDSSPAPSARFCCL